MPRFRALQGKYASRLSGILQVAYDRKPIAVNLQITGFKAYNRVRLSYTRLHHTIKPAVRRAFLFRLVSLHGARSAAGKKPPAMRVRVEGSALASKRRQSGYDTGVQVVSARKGGRFGKQGTQPVAHEVDVQVPHRVHTEV